MDLFIGSNNTGKIIEIGEVLSELGVNLIAPKDLDIEGDPEETGETYEDNAILKAKYFRAESKMPTIADDSGIVIEALAGELGVKTRRWGAGANATDEEWITYFLDRMKSEENKRASFISTIAYIDDNDQIHTFEGRCDGIITETLEADYLPGLPISACFIPDGYDKVFSALPVEEKNRISHRGYAAHKFKDFLEEQQMGGW